ncbi:hypothetical protein PIB30_075646 [Stylosanthes scabra]|uniref:Uncharacterized protein n=1 Tax=Stylosanthes scabra TaxID=79078 RepID=A0ABU6VNG7_9FABA|nr:hypothetical protein [Stylosanthes scabra]
MPQHTQNVRYQSPYLRQQFHSANDPPNKYEEVEHIRQKENQEMMEMQNQITIRLNHIAKMLQKSTSQPIQHQPQAPIPNPLPPQPLPNPKGFLNAIHDEVRSDDESKDTDNEETEQHLYELLLEMVESKDGRGANNEELMGFCEEYGSAHEDGETDQERETEDEWKKEMKSDKEKFCINTIFDMRKDEDPGACLVTCKIRGVDIHAYVTLEPVGTSCLMNYMTP